MTQKARLLNHGVICGRFAEIGIWQHFLYLCNTCYNYFTKAIKNNYSLLCPLLDCPGIYKIRTVSGNPLLPVATFILLEPTTGSQLSQTAE